MSTFKFTEVATQDNTTAQFVSEDPQYQFVRQSISLKNFNLCTICHRILRSRGSVWVNRPANSAETMLQ